MSFFGGIYERRSDQRQSQPGSFQLCPAPLCQRGLSTDLQSRRQSGGGTFFRRGRPRRRGRFLRDHTDLSRLCGGLQYRRIGGGCQTVRCRTDQRPENCCLDHLHFLHGALSSADCSWWFFRRKVTSGH